MEALLIVVFLVGYAAVAFEHQIHINKAASALLMGVLTWSIYRFSADSFMTAEQIPEWFKLYSKNSSYSVLDYLVHGQLMHSIGEIAGILFFLMGAMTIVELVDANEGFSIITSRIKATSPTRFLWTVSWITFFMSCLLDNLTTTIIMVSLMRKLVADRSSRILILGMVIIAANSGGAWTVMGDVTTTMLWIAGKITALEVTKQVFLPSFFSLFVPLVGLSIYTRYKPLGPLVAAVSNNHVEISETQKRIFLFAGVAGMISVPVFKAVTHLPPFVGMLLSLSLLWVLSEVVDSSKDEATKSSTGVVSILKKIDLSSILFFLGILMAVSALSASGILQHLASSLDSIIGNKTALAILIGLFSAIVDNVPLVAAAMEMYNYPVNDPFWMELAFCAGTGGSCLIIGSAAGVAAMGMEKIEFFWFFKKITGWALLGYFSGVACFFLEYYFFT